MLVGGSDADRPVEAVDCLDDVGAELVRGWLFGSGFGCGKCLTLDFGRIACAKTPRFGGPWSPPPSGLEYS